MLYRIICHGPRLVGYGPFGSEAEARDYADKYLQDYRNEFVPYEPPQVFDGQLGTFSDSKCCGCKPT